MRVWGCVAKKGRALYHEDLVGTMPYATCRGLLPARGSGLISLQSMHVTIKTPEEQEKMRVAGRLAAEVLDMIGAHVVPGVTTEELDRLCHDYIVERAAVDSREPQLPWVPEDHLHLREPRGVPRHPERQAPEGRRHRQHRRHRDPGWLPRRHQPHVFRRQAAPARAAPGRDLLRGHVARHRDGETRHAPRRHRACHPELRGAE